MWIFFNFHVTNKKRARPDGENLCWLWLQSDVTAPSSWGDEDSRTNENSRETPSHGESHCYTPGSVQTECRRTHTHTHTLRARRCLCCSQSCIFKLICQAHECVHADTFTYEHGCRGLRRDLGWQVSCLCPGVSGGGRSHNVTKMRAESCLSFTITVPNDKNLTLSTLSSSAEPVCSHSDSFRT